MKLLWVIQSNLFIKNEIDQIIDTLVKFDLEFEVVTVSSKKEMEPTIFYDGNIITIGTIMLSKLARELEWYPGSLLNDNYTYEKWFPHFKEYSLNKDAVFTTLGECNISSTKFIRPLDDDKTFDGKVFDVEEFIKWKSATNIDTSTKILYSSPKPVGQEYRHFIVDKKLITSSRYKLNGKFNINSNVDNATIDFVNKMIDIWTPNGSFVMDTYISGDEIGIVELGCICNAGFYGADIQKIIMALNDCYSERVE